MPADALITLILLAALLVLFYGPWQDFCTEFARQMIFRRRDKLFDLAADGRLDFASEEYRALRSSLENLIRFAHEVTWPHIAILLFVAKRHRAEVYSNSFGPLPSQAVARIKDPETRAIAAQLVDESMTALLVVILLRSLIIGPSLLLFLAGAVCVRGINNVLIPFPKDGPVVNNIRTTIERSAALTG